MIDRPSVVYRAISWGFYPARVLCVRADGTAEYVRYDHTYDENNKLHTKTITTNTVEGFFGVFKRGMKGTYQHCGPQHLQRYMDEFDFRYSNRMALGVDDTERAARAIRGAEGKRLTYQDAGSAK